jgi:16S rRNA (cytosine1402-N4)-methyltransferase
MSVDYGHQPVLLKEVVQLLKLQQGEVFFDGTVGAGGHSEKIMQAFSENILYATDRDASALALAEKRLAFAGDRVNLAQSSYADASDAFESFPLLDGILLDLGVSSMQIDQPERGFSFMAEGPLDMRFDNQTGRSAADLVNDGDREDLYKIIREYGEERYAGRVANAIVAARKERRIETTSELAGIVRRAMPRSYKKEKINPATRTFQGLRIAVNGELDELSSFLEQIPQLAAPGCRICIISFHSLEDRIVKRSFARYSQKCICPPEIPVCTCGGVAQAKKLTRKPIRPEESEKNTNVRARSALLRAIEWQGDRRKAD